MEKLHHSAIGLHVEAIKSLKIKNAAMLRTANFKLRETKIHNTQHTTPQTHQQIQHEDNKRQPINWIQEEFVLTSFLFVPTHFEPPKWISVFQQSYH